MKIILGNVGKCMLLWGTFFSIVAWMVACPEPKWIALAWAVWNAALVVLCRRCLTLRDVKRHSAAKYFDKMFD